MSLISASQESLGEECMLDHVCTGAQARCGWDQRVLGVPGPQVL